MPARLGAARFDAISRQWLDLAERRLRYYIELYQSGRWQHYYTKQGLAVRMRDVIGAVKTLEKAGCSGAAGPGCRQKRSAPRRLKALRPSGHTGIQV